MKKPTLSSCHLQSRQMSKFSQSMSSTDFFNLLTSDLLFDEVEANLPEHRERIYSPTETLSMFLSQAMSADRSCQHIVNRHAVQRSMGFTYNQSVYRRLLSSATAASY